jgi:glycosyltransferase involved in cell wall biosynthesis
MDLSIIIPMFNEAENVETTLSRVEEVAASLGGAYEIILVNDGSSDNTLEILRRLAVQNRKVKVASYPRKYGAREGIKNWI